MNFWATILVFYLICYACLYYDLQIYDYICYILVGFLILNGIETAIYFAYYRDFFFMIFSFLISLYYYLEGKFTICEKTQIFDLFLIVFYGIGIVGSILRHFDSIFFFKHHKNKLTTLKLFKGSLKPTHKIAYHRINMIQKNF